FQLFDGLQVVATGALRGAGNTRIPMLANLVGYWVIGLPLGTFLCFKLKMGAVGMWVGLCLALVLIGSALLWVWHSMIQHLMAPNTVAPGMEPSSAKSKNGSRTTPLDIPENRNCKIRGPKRGLRR